MNENEYSNLYLSPTTLDITIDVN